MDSTRKAAILLLALGREHATLLLEHLTEREVAMLSEEIADLGEIPPDKREVVFQEALQSIGGPTAAYGGVEQAKNLLALKGMDPDNIGAFHIVRDVDEDLLLQYFRREHPQAIALILSYQLPSFAASVLSKFDERAQADLALRIATMTVPTPDILEAVERDLEEQLGALAAGRVVQERGGAKELAGILNSARPDIEESILDQLALMDKELATTVRALMFVFEDIATLDDRAIQEILKNVDTKTLALAMKGVSDTVKQTLYRNLSERAQESLNEEIDLIGAVPRSEVQAARDQIIAQVRALEADGSITIRRGDDSDLIA